MLILMCQVMTSNVFFLTRTHKIFSLLPQRRKTNHFLGYLNKFLCRGKRTSKWDRGQISIKGKSFTQSGVKFGSVFLLLGTRFICFQWQAEQSEGRTGTHTHTHQAGSSGPPGTATHTSHKKRRDFHFIWITIKSGDRRRHLGAKWEKENPAKKEMSFMNMSGSVQPQPHINS